MITLNLPTFEYKLKEDNGRYLIFDILRKRYIALTPEEWVRQHFVNYLITYKGYPGGRIGNEISLNQLSYAMRLGKLGEQIVLKSPAAFDAIQFISYVSVDNTEYYAKRKARDDEARAAYRAELEKDDLNGLYMRDILREELTPDAPRLR